MRHHNEIDIRPLADRTNLGELSFQVFAYCPDNFSRGHWLLSAWLYTVDGTNADECANRFCDSQVYERLRLLSMCIVQIRKTIAPSIDAARGHTTSGARINEVTSPATEQKSSAPIAFRKATSLRKARRPIAEAARSAATATKPRMRGAIMLLLTNRFGSRHAMAGSGFEDHLDDWS